jgi:poly-gamma-glutamate capsule biosynthesis protein CapA/YwtB (metallophosphatase superfamily)
MGSIALLCATLATATPTWTLVAGGDLMLNAVAPSTKVFSGIQKLVSEAHLAYANLEVPLTDRRTATGRKSAAEVRARTQFILKASPGHAPFLAEAGFDFLSLGNNHAMDYGRAGLAQQKSVLLEKFTFTGAGENRREAEAVTVRELVPGFRVGMISYLAFMTPGAMAKCDPAGENDPGVATLTVAALSPKKQRERILAIVERAKRDCDFLMVALHWGQELQPQPRPYQVQLGRLFIDSGADLVLGAHPHVLQPGELYKGKPIVYSLGNLISPLGGSTALYRFKFEGNKLSIAEAFPASIRGGRVSLTGGSASGMVAQQSGLRRLFPNRNSEPLLK